MPQQQVNGDVPHSAAVDHILAYPVVNDSINQFKANPIGKRSLELGDKVYRTFAAPVLPWFSRPLQYVAPYIKKADDLGDRTLSKVDEKFPILKKPTQDIYSDVKTIAGFPYRVGQIGKDHVVSTYQTECKSVQSDNNLVTYGKAAITTALILTTDAYITLSNFFGAKAKEVKQSTEERTNN
ncbi:hypothetical protein B0T24DRAFT_338361 [Lasiosphaeria ovina]|uniref:CAP20-virulence factor n=1 Tax=Lasiosphaeria ovina TaxID=92902 RepID=A0AAE0K943_9PEZI|nr:hypothetical protein B0T24DRAFT_338361 [Lasiosphaeria ovina]